MHGLVTELYPLCRSITGDGLRATLRRIGAEIPLEVTEVPTGTRVLDWTVPDEWNIRDAFVKDESGRRLIDFQQHALHVVGYSVPVSARMTFEELRPHLHTLPEQPDRIPYRTSYYHRRWGFCLSHRSAEKLPRDQMFEVRIDSTLEPGSLTYAECVVPGSEPGEVLISAHCCHPSLANDNLSGVSVAVELARTLQGRSLRNSYRFLLAPAGIGAICWLARNRERLGHVRAGLVLAGVGDAGAITYKRSRRGDAVVDRAVRHVLARRAPGAEVRPFVPIGYDERQYCSPGFDLPVGCFMRTPFGEYEEYHTSADDPAFVDPESLEDSLECLLEAVDVLEGNARYRNMMPFGEPQLGRRGLYRELGGTSFLDVEEALLWVLNLSDGEHDLLSIAERSGLRFDAVRGAADALVEADLLASVPADQHDV